MIGEIGEIGQTGKQYFYWEKQFDRARRIRQVYAIIQHARRELAWDTGEISTETYDIPFSLQDACTSTVREPGRCDRAKVLEHQDDGRMIIAARQRFSRRFCAQP
jgi:hypothetical protein